MEGRDEDREQPMEAAGEGADDEGAERPERRQRREAELPADLGALLRVLGRGRIVLGPERARANTNADLVNALREGGMLGRCGAAPRRAAPHAARPVAAARAPAPRCAAPHPAPTRAAPSRTPPPPPARSDAVARAMLAVPRGAFVPVEYRDEAYVDAPIRVDAEDFNISAPHMWGGGVGSGAAGGGQA
jgi:hypothetical protein